MCIVIDEELSFEQQVTTVVKSCYIIIRKISKIKSFLSVEHLKTLVTSCIFSSLDYCNSIYYGISANLLTNLGLTSIIGFLRELHWLPVKERIIFKLLLMVHKGLNGYAPALTELFEYSASQRTCKLVHRGNSSYDDRAISCSGPRLWNMLPHEIRSQTVTVEFKKY